MCIRDRLADLRASLANTQAVVGATFDEARIGVMTIVNDFRLEAQTLRQHGIYEAEQGLARLAHGIAEARPGVSAPDDVSYKPPQPRADRADNDAVRR